MFPYGEEVTVLSPTMTADPYSGDDVASWDAPTEVVMPGVGVEPRPSGEPTQDARNAVVSGFTLYFPAGSPITAQDRVVVRGETYDVLGEPAVWRNPFTGWEPGIVVQCERTEG